MSTNKYFVSPDMFRELDALSSNMEDALLSSDIYERAEMQQLFYKYRGFRDCVSLMKALSLGYESQAEEIRGSYTGLAYDYEGVPVEDYDEEEEDEEDH